VLAVVSAAYAPAEAVSARLAKMHDVLPLVLVACHHPYILRRTQFKCWKKVLDVLRYSADDHHVSYSLSLSSLI